MIPHFMSVQKNFMVEGWMFLNVFANHEKGCFGIPFLQGFQHPGRNLRNGSIVEGEVQGWP